MDVNNILHTASMFHRTGNYEDAELLYRRILEYYPDNIHVLNYLGNVLQDQQKYDQALGCYQRAMQLNPAFAGSYYHLGALFETVDKCERAIEYYEKAIQLDSHFAGSFNNLGNVYRKLGRLDEAIPYFQKTIEIQPQFWGSYYNLGEVYQAQVRDEEAIDTYLKALQLNPHHVPSMNNLAVLMMARKQFDEALRYCEEAIHVNPEYGEPHLTKAMIQLLLGQFEEGWKEYEWRWKTRDAEAWQRKCDKPLWNGMPTQNKTLLIWAEQGIGDEIMFASCIPDVMSLIGSCVIECDKRLVPLFSRSFPQAEILERRRGDDPVGMAQQTMHSYDLVIAAGSLPVHLRPRVSSFPNAEAFLLSDKGKVAEWKKRMRTLPAGLRVGISWRGGKDPRERKIRSVDMALWKDILHIKGVSFINLQYDTSEKEIDEIRDALGITVYHWLDADPLKDLDTSAAQIAALDLVISVDNATVHLAGALGVPVWTLLPYSPNWRWMLDREDTPWYPSMKLFRQPTFGDWETVMEVVCHELENMVQG